MHAKSIEAAPVLHSKGLASLCLCTQAYPAYRAAHIPRRPFCATLLHAGSTGRRRFLSRTSPHREPEIGLFLTIISFKNAGIIAVALVFPAKAGVHRPPERSNAVRVPAFAGKTI